MSKNICDLCGLRFGSCECVEYDDGRLFSPRTYQRKSEESLSEVEFDPKEKTSNQTNSRSRSSEVVSSQTNKYHPFLQGPPIP